MESQFASFLDNVLNNEDIMNLCIEEWFNKIDSNKNNLIEPGEFSPFMVDFFKTAKIPNMTEEKVNELFQKVDIDKNGVIERNELKPLIKKIILHLKNQVQKKK